MKIGSLVRAANCDELKGNGPFALSANGVDVVVVRTPAGLRAFEGRCPHQGALLGEGEFDGERLVCRNHRWRFRVDSGQRDGGEQCLASCPVVEREGGVYVDISGLVTGRQPVKTTRAPDDLPGPKGIPFLGNLHQIDLRKVHLDLERWAVQFGPVFRYRIGPRQIVVVNNKEWCEQALRARPETFRRGAVLGRILEELKLEGVFSAEGQAWRPQRRLSVAALAQRNFKALHPKIQMVTERLLNRWRRRADAGAALDIADELKRFTVDVTTLITFGYDINTIEQDDEIIQRKLDVVFPALLRRLFAPYPLWRYVRLPRDRRLEQTLDELRAWLDELIAVARARLAEEPERAEKPTNFIEAMLTTRDDEGKLFSSDVIFANLMNMLLAGEDTTANTLAWAVHQLLESPYWASELRREADTALQASDTTTSVEMSNGLACASAVANETMRLRPVGPLIGLTAKVDTTLDDLALPKGTALVFLTRPAATDAAFFDDPLAFRPERWLGQIAGAHDASAHIPFGSGPRMCPGRALALVEMNTLLSMLYKNFDVERAGDADDVEEKFGLTMSPMGLKVRLRRRVGAETLAAAE
jgi:cytochrome P450/nitrite reductase/ring-hydroxylating ferredoxin subunit